MEEALPVIEPETQLVVKSKHPLAIRWFHWANFPILFTMIWSGILIYWANPQFGIIPSSWYERFGWNQRLAEGMAWHFFFMWFFTVNGIAYVLFTIFSGQWRFLVPNGASLKEAIQVVLHDLRIRKEPLPPRKYNGAQQIAYTGVVLMGFGSLVTGLAIYKPTQLSWLVALTGGYTSARFIHFWLMIGYLAFFVVHLVQVLRAGWNNFRSMVTGKELVAEEITS